jgi:hypothetical protein
MKEQRRESKGQLCKLFIQRDIAADLSYKANEKLSWKFAGVRWESTADMMNFSSPGRPFPGTAEKGPICGPRCGSGSMEYWGYVRDITSLRSWALAPMNVKGSVQLVSLVNLKGGDDLGTIPGISSRKQRFRT